MVHSYTIKGMTCAGCKASVEEHLQSLDKVDRVEVDLEASEARITMNSHIATETLKRALPSKYTLSEKDNRDVFASQKNTFEHKSKLQELKPLFLIFAYLIVATLLLNKETLVPSEIMLDFMGLFYFVFSFFKLLDIKGFAQSFSMYDPLAGEFPLYGRLYPFIEVALGVMLLYRFEVEVALAITIIVLGLTTVGVTKTLLSKKEIKCACLGTTLNLPMTEATFIENAIMILMALAMILGWV